MTEKVVEASESLFRPVNGVRSTRLLVEIHNTQHFEKLFTGAKVGRKGVGRKTVYEINPMFRVGVYDWLVNSPLLHSNNRYGPYSSSWYVTGKYQDNPD